MTAATHTTNNKLSIWRRVFIAIKAHEDAMDIDPLEQAIIGHQTRITELETKVASLETANPILAQWPPE